MTPESNSNDSTIKALDGERKKYKLLFGATIVVALIIIGSLLLLYGSDISSPTLLAVAIIVSMIAGLSFWGSQKGEWYLHPLGLPRGSIRAIIALLFVMTILLAANNFKEESKDSASGETTPSSLPDWLMGIVGTIIGFYFGERSSEDKEKDNISPDAITQLAMIAVLKKSGAINDEDFKSIKEKLLNFEAGHQDND